jgi:hypothetical protein
MGTKITLVLLGIFIIVMGFLTFFGIGNIKYYAIAEVVIGLLGAIIGLMAKRPQQ